MTTKVGPVQRGLIAERTRRLMLQDGAAPETAAEAYQHIASGQADQQILENPHVLEGLHDLGKLPVRETGDPEMRTVDAEKERQRFVRSRQGRARKPEDPNRILAAIAHAARTPKASSHLQGGDMHFMVVGEPYLPCTLPLDDLKIIKLSDLREETHHRGKALVVRRVGELAVGRSSAVCCVEDETGDVEALRVFHFSDKFGHEPLPSGIPFAIKEPYFTFSEHKEGQLRIDHPSDLLLLSPTDARLPTKWRWKSDSMSTSDWKDQGNAAVKRKCPAEALRCYTYGLQAVKRESGVSGDEEALLRTLHRNRSLVNLGLECYDAALADALAALPGRNGRDDQGKPLDALDSKAYYRAGCAAYHLRDFSAAEEYLKRQLQLTPEEVAGTTLLHRTKVRIREQQGLLQPEGCQRSLSAQRPRLDVADWTSKVEVKESPGRGRGLFATEDIPFGNVIMYEKAFYVVWEHDEDVYVTYKYNTRTDDMRGGNTSLWQNVVQKLSRNGSLVPKVAALHGLWKGTGTEQLIVDGQQVIDTFQIHDIVSRNCFGLAAVSDTGLYDREIAHIANNGVWIHTSYLNHSCVPNAARDNIGDVMIIRAGQPIAKGDEVFIAYNDLLESFDERQTEMTNIWGFQCRCPLCQAEAQDSPEMRAKRTQLAERAKSFRKEHQAGSYDKAPPKTVVQEAEKLAQDLAATYDPKRYDSLPREALANIQCWLISAYASRRDKKIEMACAVLRSSGYEVIEKPFSVRQTATSSASGYATLALLFLSAIKLRTGEPDVARKLNEMSKKMCEVNGRPTDEMPDPTTMEV